MRKVRATIRHHTARTRLRVPLRELVDTLNRTIRGWRAYFAIGNSTKKLADLDRYVIFPGESGQVDYAAHVTFRTCRLSNALGLRYPSDECSRYGL